MIEFILSLFTGGNAIFGWLLAALAAVATFYVKGRSDGSAKAENKALRQTIKAKDEQLEMHREATQDERDAAALSDDQARKEAMKWSNR